MLINFLMMMNPERRTPLSIAFPVLPHLRMSSSTLHNAPISNFLPTYLNFHVFRP